MRVEKPTHERFDVANTFEISFVTTSTSIALEAVWEVRLLDVRCGIYLEERDLRRSLVNRDQHRAG